MPQFDPAIYSLVLNAVTTTAIAAASYIYVSKSISDRIFQKKLEESVDAIPSIGERVDDFFSDLGTQWAPNLKFYHPELVKNRTFEHVDIYMGSSTVTLTIGDNEYVYHGFPGQDMTVATCSDRHLTITFDRDTGIPEFAYSAENFVQVTKRELSAITEKQLHSILSREEITEILVTPNGTDSQLNVVWVSLTWCFKESSTDGFIKSIPLNEVDDIVVHTQNGQFYMTRGCDKDNSPFVAIN